MQYVFRFGSREGTRYLVELPARGNFEELFVGNDQLPDIGLPVRAEYINFNSAKDFEALLPGKWDAGNWSSGNPRGKIYWSVISRRSVFSKRIRVR